jgi:hypothetical protein
MSKRRLQRLVSKRDVKRDVKVDETQTAAMRGVSAFTQARHRKAGKGPKAHKPEGAKGYYYWLSEIQAEQESAA